MNIHTKLFWRQSPNSIVSESADLDGGLGVKNKKYVPKYIIFPISFANQG
jgi:hypothetical protein